MADQRPRGRGRGRGRGGDGSGGSTSSSQPIQQRHPHTTQSVWGGGLPPQQGPSTQSAWGGSRPQQPPRGPPAPGASWGPRPSGSNVAPQPRPTGQTTAGRATHRQPVERISEKVSLVNIGDSGALTGSGRGATRGRRNVAVDILRTRPANTTTKSGTYGQAIRLQTNYFELLSTPDWRLFDYSVTFDPKEDEMPLCRKMIRVQEKVLGGGGFLYIGSNIYTSHRLEKDIMEVFSEHPTQKIPVRITFKLVQELPPTSFAYIQLFNSLIRSCLRALKLQLVGRNYFDPLAKINIHEHRLELWPGYVTSIRQHENKILMCSEITHKVMRHDTVLDLLKQCYHENPKDVRNLFEKRIIGAVVLTDYNSITYRIDDVDWESSPSSSFKTNTNDEVTYKNYYMQKYSKDIRDMHQPMLVSRAKPNEIRVNMPRLIYLVPELCRLTGLTDSQRSNFQLMQALAKHTRVAPDNRIRKLIAFSKRLLNNPDITELFKRWNLKLSDQLTEVAGRVLPPETIYGRERDAKFSAGVDADWTKELRLNPMHIIAPINQWVCIWPNNLKNKARDFVEMIIKTSRGMQFNIPPPKVHEIRDDRVPIYLEALESSINNYRPQMILCIVSNNKLDRYSAIKKKCCVDRAVPTQVITTRTLMGKSAMSIATKVGIQINCKLGGAAWGIDIPLKGIMIVGFDVYHDTMDKSKSYGAMVASMNSTCSQYYSTCTPHNKGNELSNDFALNISKAVKKFQEIQKTLPSCIVIYRDGVGDGQIHQVYEHEVNLTKKALEKIYVGDSVRMAFIIVSKSINTRFFFKGNNPPPGTVIDDVVTLPERYDFFIVSQSVKQGTVSPTSYNVIDDSTGLDPDKIQRLTYKLCHMYFNWSGTVRVPAPCQYAHKLAFLVGSALHRQPNPQLASLLYYL